MNLIDQANARQFARDALKTVPGISTAELHGFVSSLSENQTAPSFFAMDLPVWVSAEVGGQNTSENGTSISFVRTENADADPGHSEDMLVLHGPGYENWIVVRAPVEILSRITEQRGGNALSVTEIRLAAQLLSGLSLADAAAADKVAYETRRNQFKVLAGKLGVSRQQDVMRLLVQDLMVALAPAFGQREENALLYDYQDRFLPEGVRVAILFDRENPPTRVVEYGPQGGRPVMILHPMIFPDITEENLHFARDHNLRVIFPLRPGLLQSEGASTASNTTMMASRKSLDLVWQTYCGVPVPLIAMVSSGAQATDFASAFPERITSLTFAATCFSAGYYRPSAIYFGSSLAELALRSSWMLSRTMNVLRNKFSTREKFEPAIRRIFSGSLPDSEVLAQEFAHPNEGARLMSVVLNSGYSLRADYFNQVHFNWATVRQLNAPVRFIHGDADSIHDAEDMRRLGELAGCPDVEILEGVGHLIQHGDLNGLIARTLQAT